MRSKKTKENTSVKKIHFIGVGGSGMSATAFLAEQAGYTVSGCDKEDSTAYNKSFIKGHSTSHLNGVDLVVVTPALFFLQNSIDEVVEAKKRGVLITWQEFLGKYLAKNKKMICVAGTHGKSTSTTMLGRVLEEGGLDPSIMVGANVPEWNGGARFGGGDYFVVEADEFYNNFLNYSPEVILLNNIEFDHPDFFKSEQDLYYSFQKFLDKMVGLKVLVANEDSKGVRNLLQTFTAQKFQIVKFSPKKEKLGFDLKVIGEHNKANALGVMKVSQILGIDKKVIQTTLQNFNGIGRRMELLGKNKKGVLVYDDYAHHPTAVQTTLHALREKHNGSKIYAIYEPHSFSRTKALLKFYKDVFSPADQVIITPIFKARDKDNLGITEKDLLKAIKHKSIENVDNFKEVVNKLSKVLGKGDVVIVMGAGQSYKLARDILNL